ncbi:MAG: LPS-assembly protein LptD [Pseudomonadota bacterium]
MVLCALGVHGVVEGAELCPLPPEFIPVETPPGMADDAMRGEADRMETLENRRVLLEGDVLLEGEGRRLRADRATMDRDSGVVELQGHVVLENDTMQMRADRGQYDQRQRSGTFSGAEYRLYETRGNGRAESLVSDNPSLTVLDGAVYTTCEPGDPEWELYTSRLVLDRESGMGTAHHMRLHLFDVPVFYWPWITFPITDERKSGLLFPSFASSGDGGFEYAQPVYWNIAPQADATVTPRYIEKRGTQANLQTRYLNRWGDFQFDGSYLDDRDYGDTRWFSGFEHNGRLGQGWSSYVDTARVSDEAFFDDLDTGVGIGNVPVHLKSQGGVRYRGAIWRHQIGVQRYQTVDLDIASANRPYSREPFVRSSALYDWGGYELDLKAESVRFAHDERVEGQRLDLYPSLATTFGTPGWYVRPKAGVRHTAYQLDNLTDTSEEAPSRTTPIASIDSGLVFEREAGEGLLHTLEPRLYGLYVAEEEQENLPLFDTGAYTFSYDQLFRENRFTGADRQADARQVTAGVTSRLLDSSYRELLSASIGRIYYLDDREVTLDESAPAERGQASDIAARLRAQLGPRWRFDGNWQYSRELERMERQSYQLRYKDEARRIVNLGYRESESLAGGTVSGVTEQAEVAAVLPVGGRWQWFARYFHDLAGERPLETFAGFNYQSCCWGVSFMARRQLDLINPSAAGEDEYDTDYMMQFTFRGLASVGDDNERTLEHAILGYAE